MPKFQVKFEKTYTVTAETEEDAQRQAEELLDRDMSAKITMLDGKVPAYSKVLNVHVWIQSSLRREVHK